jgi:CDGSH-type Zn-finger protein
MSDIVVTPLDNGPLRVEGRARVVDASGKVFETTETILLCRCGHSGNKPFCDGTHNKIDFKEATRAT